MKRLIEYDTRIAIGLGRLLWKIQARVNFDVHSLVFWSAVALYSLVWWALCRYDQKPDWIWFVLGPGAGAIATYIVDDHAVAFAEDHIGLTQSGLDERWSLLRILNLPLIWALIVQMLLNGSAPVGMAALLFGESLLFALVQYLLAFRLVKEMPAQPEGGMSLQDALQQLIVAAQNKPDESDKPADSDEKLADADDSTPDDPPSA